MSTGTTGRDPMMVTCHDCGQDYNQLYTHHICPPYPLRARALEEKVDLLIVKVSAVEVLVSKLVREAAE